MKILNHCYPKSPQPTISTPYKTAKSPQLEKGVEKNQKKKKGKEKEGKEEERERRGEGKKRIER